MDATNVMTTPKTKGQISSRNSGGKVKDRVHHQDKETTKTTAAKIPEQRSNLDITVQS